MISIDEFNYDGLKPYLRKLVNNQDVSEISGDTVVFHGVELNYAEKNWIKFVLCDRIVAKDNKDGTYFIQIYQKKDSEPVEITFP